MTSLKEISQTTEELRGFDVERVRHVRNAIGDDVHGGIEEHGSVLGAVRHALVLAAAYETGRHVG